MRRFTCKQVEPSIASYVGAELGDDERAAIAVHLDVCESCRELAEVWQALPRVAREAELDPVSPESEQRLLSADSEERPSLTQTGTRTRAVIGMALAAAIIIGLGVVLWLALLGGTDHEVDHRLGTTAPESMGSGSDGDEQTQLALDDRGRRVITLGLGERLILDESARIHVLESGADATVCRAVLEAGSIDVELGSAERSDDLAIETPAGTVSAREAVFSLEVAGDNGVEVGVTEGVVQAKLVGDERTTTLQVGQRTLLEGAAPAGSAGKPAKVAAQPAFESAPAGLTIDGLLKQARQYRKARRFERAADSYERLIRSFPGSGAATSSLVALGQMELGSMGRAASALSHFEAYLKVAPGGVLAEEARAGRVRAQARLGRSRALIRAATEYLREHPGGRATSEMLRRRADARRRVGACADAVRDYRRIVEKWPGSTEAELAVKGLDACSAAP
jgi:TolA-binding protein